MRNRTQSSHGYIHALFFFLLRSLQADFPHPTQWRTHHRICPIACMSGDTMDWHNINEVLENSFLPFGNRIILSSKRKGKELFILDNHNQALTFKEWKDPLLNATLIVKKIKYAPTLEEVRTYEKTALASAYINEHFKKTE